MYVCVAGYELKSDSVFYGLLVLILTLSLQTRGALIRTHARCTEKNIVIHMTG